MGQKVNPIGLRLGIIHMDLVGMQLKVNMAIFTKIYRSGNILKTLKAVSPGL